MLELKNIGFKTEDGKEILKDISIKIEDSFVAITGPNGSGKSTLAKVIAGIYKSTSGQIIYNGTDITDMSITERANLGISFAFQQPVRFKGLKVKDLLSLASGGEKSITECCNLLSEVGLCARDYIDRDLDDSLSGGEIKRIEIATVLLRESKLIIFDEPEAGIDLWSFNNLIRVFEEIRDSRKASLVVISHQERILSIADEIVMVQAGQIGLHGDGKKVFHKLLCKNDCDDCCGKEEN